MSKITIVGISGSGKTCYMIGLYTRMLLGANGFSMTTSKDFQKLKGLMQRLCDENLPIVDRFPPASDHIDTYTLSLKYALKEIDEIEWIDYPGGNFANYNLDDPVNKEFCEHVTSSDCLFICVDGNAFAEDNANKVINQLNLYQGGSNTNLILNAIATQNSDKIPPICVIITKYDKIPAYLRDNDSIYSIVSQVFPVLFTPTDFNQRIVSICPVSLGKDFDTVGKFEPLNVELPIFFATFFKKFFEAKTNEKEIQKNRSKLKELSGSFFKSLFNKDHIETLQNDIETLEKKKENIGQSIEVLKEQITDLPIYLNGQKICLEEIK